MRSLYWKIFISFWLATILIILSIAWISSEITRQSSIPAREQVFMDSYANAAVATFESGHYVALRKWLEQIGQTRKITLYLLSSTGEIISNKAASSPIIRIANDLITHQLNDGLQKLGDIIISHEILSTSGKSYRLVAVSETPLHHYIDIPWASLALRVAIAILISGPICYLLSLYLTQPLRALSLAAKSIATGKLSTRVGHFKGHKKDEIAELSAEFDRMAEKLESLVNAKERLLQDISHELRSPLARLQIAIELGRKKANHLAEIEFSRMEMECIRLNTLIGEILHFARLDKSVEELSKAPVNMTNLLNQIVHDANYEFSEITPRVNINALPAYVIQGDERLLHRAIENITRNALHYSPDNALVMIQAYVKQQHLIIEIADEGSGVPEKQLQKIFSPFYRVDKSRAKRTGGYGLGLSIAEKAIKLHNGIIFASNRATGGLQITIELPLTHDTQDEIHEGK